MQHDPHRPEDVLKVDCDEDGVGEDDAADRLRYLVATKGRAISERKLREVWLTETKVFVQKIPHLANVDDTDDRGLSCGFSDKELCTLIGGKFLCFCHNHRPPVRPICIDHSNGISEVRESAW